MQWIETDDRGILNLRYVREIFLSDSSDSIVLVLDGDTDSSPNRSYIQYEKESREFLEEKYRDIVANLEVHEI